MIQNKKYENAEISLHIALDLAKKQDNMDGVIYTYDVMANLAFERKEFWKAKELFSEILQLLLSKGLEQSDPKVILFRRCDWTATKDAILFNNDSETFFR